MVIVGKIVQLLAQLIKDSTTHVDEKDMVSDSSRWMQQVQADTVAIRPSLLTSLVVCFKDQSGMYRKLKTFEDERRTHTTSSTAKERFRFWKKEKDRKKCLKALRTWNRTSCV